MKSKKLKTKRTHNNVFNFDWWAFAATFLFGQFVFQEYICALQA